ncbi:MAG TPA: DUF3667 domain-containing protein [Gammaproteobacteria bacterium]
MTELLHEIALEVSALDGRFLRSIRKLLFSPGFLTKEHIEGRRAKWLPSIRMYLVIGVVYFGVVTILVTAAVVVPAALAARS